MTKLLRSNRSNQSSHIVGLQFEVHVLKSRCLDVILLICYNESKAQLDNRIFKLLIEDNLLLLLLKV